MNQQMTHERSGQPATRIGERAHLNVSTVTRGSHRRLHRFNDPRVLVEATKWSWNESIRAEIGMPTPLDDYGARNRSPRSDTLHSSAILPSSKRVTTMSCHSITLSEAGTPI